MLTKINADKVGNEVLKKIEPEADGVVKDGQTIRFRMTMMDAAVQQELAGKFAPKPFVADNHMPRSAVLTDEQKKAAQDRIAADKKRLSDAWRNPEPAFVGANFPHGGPGNVTPQRSGTSIKTDEPGVIHAPGSPTNAAELNALQAANQAKYNQRLEAAYKGE